MKIIKKFFWVLLLFVSLTSVTDAAVIEENELLHQSGGGLTLEMLSLDLFQLNEMLKDNEFEPLDDKMFIYGGNLFSQTENNLRYANFGSGGSVTSTTVDGKTAALSLTQGGVWLEQILPLNPSLAISGIMATSLGSLKLNLIHDTVDSIEEGFVVPQETLMKATIFMIKPMIGINYSLKRYLDVEFKVGYHYSHTLGDWQQGGQKIPGEQILTQMHGMSLLLNVSFGF